MMIRVYLLAITLLLGLAGVGEAQERAARRGGPGPIHTLLELRDELRLTDAQIGQLQSIETATEELNRPLVSGLREIRHKVRSLGPLDNLSPEQQALFDSYWAEARPLMREIERNNCAAMKQVGAVLSDWQKGQMKAILKQASEDSGGNSRIPRPTCRGA